MTTQSSIMSPVRLGDGLVELLTIVKPNPTEHSWDDGTMYLEKKARPLL
jgi:hypothetical protein